MNDQLPKPLPIQPEEMDILSPRSRLSCDEWAEKYRKLSSKTTNLAGDWSNDYVPFMVEPMRAASDVGTRQVTVSACSQASKTELLLNFTGWVIDQSPGPLLTVLPTEADTNRRVNTRLRYLFESTPQLLRHLPGGKLDALNIGKETILDNMIMYTGWAGSPAAMADNPVCYVILDEVCKFPVSSGKEADPVSLAKDRQRTFYARSKLLCVSTPVHLGDLIDREYNAGSKEQHWGRCPHCGESHVFKWACVVLDKTKSGRLLDPRKYEDGGHARYACPRCGACWTEQHRWQAVCDGRWAPSGCVVDVNGRIVGTTAASNHRSFRVTAMMLYPGFQTIDRLALDWAAAQLAKKAGDVGPLQNFINSQLDEPWVEAQKHTDIDKLRPHIGTYKSGLVPAGVVGLTAGIDVQIDHVWVTVTGWGYMSEAWSIFDGRIETGDTKELSNYKLIQQLLYYPWPLADVKDKVMYICKAAIDCGYRGDVVFDFCRQCSPVDIVPVRGDDTVRTRTFRAVKIGGGAMIRYDLNVTVLKDRLYRLLFEASVPGPGFFHLHADTDDDTLQQLTSEEQLLVRKGRGGKKKISWELKKQHRENHLWDCRVYSAFAGELAGVRLIADSAGFAAPQRVTAKPKGGGFLDNLPRL